MHFNLYKVYFDSNQSLKTLNSDDLNIEIYNKLQILEDNIIELYKEKQEGRKGIENLGNEIRYDKNIRNIFSETDNFILVKATGNRMSIANQLIDILINYVDKPIFLFIINYDFNRYSRIFDGTSTGLNDIKTFVEKLSYVINDKYKNINLYVIEFSGLDNYTFQETEGKYSKLIKKINEF